MPVTPPVLGYSETNGAGPTGTSTDYSTGGSQALVYASSDQASSTSNLATQNPINAGTNAFEKWWRMYVSTVAPTNITAFSVYFSGTAPTDGAGTASTLTMKFTTNVAYQSPSNTAMAESGTGLCSSTTSPPGVSFTSPTNTTSSPGKYSGYIITQLQVAAGASGGPVTFPAAWLYSQFSWF